MGTYSKIVICPLSHDLAEKASTLGEKLKLPVLNLFAEKRDLSVFEFCLLVDDQRLFLQKIG